MTAPPVMGRTLVWHPIQDPQGGRGLSDDGRLVAELWWSPDDRGVRAEVGDDVWTVRLAGTRPLTAAVSRGSEGAPVLLFAGGARRGLVRGREGGEFEIFTQLDWRRGAWMGIDHVDASGVLRVQGRLGLGGFLWDVSVTPDPRYRSVAWPLLLLWGALEIARRKRPGLRFSSGRMPGDALRAVLDDLAWAGEIG